ncbi:uncharacterized protein LY79DRAFT_243580 [Colletotrichum navitas]|uniref:Uncharacterized protein n=1 Tax=Colletotrichum navitas TaxID=681940 RepID=A0AAD8PWH4_9PEZI|nr:uncharacterized protein LY79DRAFT_243580 [Colletotrichum navitas]KAK1585992.1 hypothetical protein LY79DRAFT_243580 [Colletotrichum navitas]
MLHAPCSWSRPLRSLRPHPRGTLPRNFVRSYPAHTVGCEGGESTRGKQMEREGERVRRRKRKRERTSPHRSPCTDTEYPDSSPLPSPRPFFPAHPSPPPFLLFQSLSLLPPIAARSEVSEGSRREWVGVCSRAAVPYSYPSPLSCTFFLATWWWETANGGIRARPRPALFLSVVARYLLDWTVWSLSSIVGVSGAPPKHPLSRAHNFSLSISSVLDTKRNGRFQKEKKKLKSAWTSTALLITS